MRILGFSKLDWMNYNMQVPKLVVPTFTTFRMPRRDKDWQAGEEVKVVLRPRTKDREYLGQATITVVQAFEQHQFTDAMARQDGFLRKTDLYLYLVKAHRGRLLQEKVNRLTLTWNLWQEPLIRFSRDWRRLGL